MSANRKDPNVAIPPSITQISDKSGLKLPTGYCRVHELGLVNLHPWFFLDDIGVISNYSKLNSRYLVRQVLPFARTLAADDIACFVVAESAYSQGEIVIIHDDAHPGTEVEQRFDSFWAWFRFAIEEMVQLEISREA